MTAGVNRNVKGREERQGEMQLCTPYKNKSSLFCSKYKQEYWPRAVNKFLVY